MGIELHVLDLVEAFACWLCMKPLGIWLWMKPLSTLASSEAFQKLGVQKVFQTLCARSLLVLSLRNLKNYSLKHFQLDKQGENINLNASKKKKVNLKT